MEWVCPSRPLVGKEQRGQSHTVISKHPLGNNKHHIGRLLLIHENTHTIADKKHRSTNACRYQTATTHVDIETRDNNTPNQNQCHTGEGATGFGAMADATCSMPCPQFDALAPVWCVVAVSFMSALHGALHVYTIRGHIGHTQKPTYCTTTQ